MLVDAREPITTICRLPPIGSQRRSGKRSEEGTGKAPGEPGAKGWRAGHEEISELLLF